MAEKRPTDAERVVTFLQDGACKELLRYLYSAVPSHDVGEVLHEIWLRCKRSKEALLAAQHPVRYLFGIAGHEVQAYYRRHYGSRLRVGEHFLHQDEPGNIPFDDVSREQLIARINEALPLLPAEHAGVFVCVVVREMSYSETAELLGITIYQVERYLLKAKVRLAGLLGRENL